jgi:hypothetical protein
MAKLADWREMPFVGERLNSRWIGSQICRAQPGGKVAVGRLIRPGL